MCSREGQVSKTCWTEMVPFSVPVAHSAHLPFISVSTLQSKGKVSTPVDDCSGLLQTHVSKTSISPAFLHASKICAKSGCQFGGVRPNADELDLQLSKVSSPRTGMFRRRQA